MIGDGWEGNPLYPQKLFGWRIFKAIPLKEKVLDFFFLKESIGIERIDWTTLKKSSWVLSPIGSPNAKIYPDLIDGTWTQDAKCTLIYTEHESPATDCSCGYWCLYNLRGLMVHPVSDSLFSYVDYYVGYVEVSGKIVIGTMGFRAQKMRLKGLLSMEALYEYGPKWNHFSRVPTPSSTHYNSKKMYDIRFHNVPRLDYKEAIELPDSHARDFLEKSDREHDGTLQPSYCPCDLCYTYYTMMRKEELKSFDNTEPVRYNGP